MGGRTSVVLVILVIQALLAADEISAGKDAAGEFAGADQQQQRPMGICAMRGCNCTIEAHRWIVVKCRFDGEQDVDLSEGVIPEDAMEVSIAHCRELRIKAGAFSAGVQPPPKRIQVKDIKLAIANRLAYESNNSAPNPFLDVSKCHRVVLESHAFRNSRSPVNVAISDCQSVAVKAQAFSWLLNISVRRVPFLELASEAFKFENPYITGRTGVATKILLEKVNLEELPGSVFPSPVHEVRIDDSRISVVRKDAFCAMDMKSVVISNVSINEIQSGAFCDRSLIVNLEFADARIDTVRSGAFKAGTSNFTIQFSSFSEIEPGALDIAVAAVTLNNNDFGNLRRNSLVLNQWNNIAINNNLFRLLEANAITANTDATRATTFDFAFHGNRIVEAQPESLGFTEVAQSVTRTKLGSNYFNRTCNCRLEAFFQGLIGPNSSVSFLMDTSFCVLDAEDPLIRCFRLPEGYLNTRNYTQQICQRRGSVNCAAGEAPKSRLSGAAVPPKFGPHDPKRVGIGAGDRIEFDKHIMVVICISTVFGLIVVILVAGILYVRRRGACRKLNSSNALNRTSSWVSPNGALTATTSTRSLSRLSTAHEYSGLHAEASRHLDSGDDEDEEGSAAAGECRAILENKATQTLPEELSEGLLNELKEKLNDPNNYSFAKDMIEHLYDLIKVEESCNNNVAEATESLGSPDRSSAPGPSYDFIASSRPRARPVSRQPTISMGTKAPSLDKLLPSTKLVVRQPQAQPRPELTSEYAQPHDHQQPPDPDQAHHLYAELPGDETVPSTSRLAQQPVFASLAVRAPLPLPPDALDRKRPRNRAQQQQQNGTTRSAKDSSIDRAAKRSLFFRTMEGSAGNSGSSGNKAQKRSLLLADEYADPAHLYAELPEPGRSSASPATTTTPTAASRSSPHKMANRPLPTKPDQSQSSCTTT